MHVGTYREQLLKETGGRSAKELFMQDRREESPSGFLTAFKVRFTISLFLFGIFAWMSLTDRNIGQLSAGQIEEAVESDLFQQQISDYLAKLGLYE